MRVLSRVLFVLLLVGACAPFHKTSGDVCNDPTQNYKRTVAYECN